jgi:hypothetical protein
MANVICRTSPSAVKPMGTVIAGAPVWGATAGLKFLASSAAYIHFHGSSWSPDVISSTPYTHWSVPTFSCGPNISQALRGSSPSWVNDGLHVGSVHRTDLVLQRPHLVTNPDDTGVGVPPAAVVTMQPYEV